MFNHLAGAVCGTWLLYGGGGLAARVVVLN